VEHAEQITLTSKTDTGLTRQVPVEVNGVGNIDSGKNLLLVLAHGVCDLLHLYGIMPMDRGEQYVLFLHI
jgi:hypothetical protein